MTKSIGYFAGANGEKGFVSYFDGVLSPLKRVYVLKGGCGCGKSRLMGRVAARAEAEGLGVHRIYCASDPDSLDGVVIPSLGIGVADGTAPHEISPRLTGAADVLVDLGEYLDTPALRRREREIRAHTKEKAACTQRAYSLLAATGELKAERDRLLKDAVLWDKMAAAAGRLAKKQGDGKGFSAALRLREAFCAHGTAVASDYGEEHRYTVRDPYGIAHLFYEQLLAAAHDRGLALTVSPDPMSPDRIGALLFEGAGTLFCTHEQSEDTVNMERFVSKPKIAAVRQKLRFVNRVAESLSLAARQALAEGRAHHAALESIYTPTMDFERVNQRTERLLADIFA